MKNKLVAFVLCLFSATLLLADEHKKEDPLFIYDGEKKIEFFYSKPQGDGPFPVIFLLHGFQPSEKSEGGKQLVNYGQLDRFVNDGIVAVAVSTPGFGGSTGPSDHSGPYSQKAVISVINHFKTLPFIDSSRIGIYGGSRGAELASMVSTEMPELCFQVLENGRYDLVNVINLLPDYLQSMRSNILVEAGADEESQILRSAVYHADKIKTSTLILHGEFDDRRGLPSALNLHGQLVANGVDSRIKIFSGQNHFLTPEKYETITPFVREKFFGLFGIGINLTEAMPAFQITKIFSGSSAERSGKLRIGDAILKISPNNDEIEIDVLRMPMSKFVSYVLGKKGTSLRLVVQHFDLSYETIVLERG